MPDEILILGKRGLALKNAIEEIGYKIISAGKHTKSQTNPCLIIIDTDSLTVAKKMISSSKGVPKLLIQADNNSSFPQWLINEPHTSLACPMPEKSLVKLALRLAKEGKSSINQASVTRRLKEELSYHERMNILLSSSKEIDAILRTIMKHALELTFASAWSIALIEESTGDVIIERMSGTTGGKSSSVHKRFKAKEGIAGWVLQHGKPIISLNALKDKRYSPSIDKHPHTKSGTMLCVPIIAKGRILGAIELINKSGGPFTDDDLSTTLKLASQAALAIERNTLNSRLEELVLTDDLTKLFNTRYLNKTIENEVQRSARYQMSVSLIFVDLDHFKDVNDNHGHLIGGKVLVETGQVIINQLRAVDTVARYGGDEFVIILPQTELANAMKVAERIRKSIDNHMFLKSEGYNLKITASFGVASYPESAKSKEELVRLADESMYKVKHRTRNGVYAII